MPLWEHHRHQRTNHSPESFVCMEQIAMQIQVDPTEKLMRLLTHPLLYLSEYTAQLEDVGCLRELVASFAIILGGNQMKSAAVYNYCEEGPCVDITGPLIASSTACVSLSLIHISFMICQEFEQFNRRLNEVSKRVRIPLPVSNILWEHCIRLANRTIVEG